MKWYFKLFGSPLSLFIPEHDFMELINLISSTSYSFQYHQSDFAYHEHVIQLLTQPNVTATCFAHKRNCYVQSCLQTRGILNEVVPFLTFKHIRIARRRWFLHEKT